jgi:hypothetical protein
MYAREIYNLLRLRSFGNIKKQIKLDNGRINLLTNTDSCEKLAKFFF